MGIPLLARIYLSNLIKESANPHFRSLPRNAWCPPTLLEKGGCIVSTPLSPTHVHFWGFRGFLAPETSKAQGIPGLARNPHCGFLRIPADSADS